MTDDELWAAIGAAVRAQGRCIRIFDAWQRDGSAVPMVTTPLRPRKKPRAAHLAVLRSGKLWDATSGR